MNYGLINMTLQYGKNIKYGGNPNFYKCNKQNIISNETNKHIVKLLKKNQMILLF